MTSIGYNITLFFVCASAQLLFWNSGTFCKCYKPNQYIILENLTQHVQADSDRHFNTTSTAIEESQEMLSKSGDTVIICINDGKIGD